MGFKVVHTYALPGIDHGDILLESLDASLVKGVWLNEDEIISNTKDADAIIGVVSRQPFNRRVFKNLRNCRIIAGIAIGFEAVDLEAATEFGIAVTNVPDYCLEEVSDLTMALILACVRKIVVFNNAVHAGQWELTNGKPIYRL